MESLLPGQFQKVGQETEGSTCSESIRGLGRGLWGQGGECPPHLGPGSGVSQRALVAEAGVDILRQVDSILG